MQLGTASFLQIQPVPLKGTHKSIMFIQDAIQKTHLHVSEGDPSDFESKLPTFPFS